MKRDCVRIEIGGEYHRHSWVSIGLLGTTCARKLWKMLGNRILTWRLPAGILYAIVDEKWTFSSNGIAQSQTECRTVMSIKANSKQTSPQSSICGGWGSNISQILSLAFSSLIFPLGYILNSFGGHSDNIGCFDNLHKSIEDFNVKGYMKSEERRQLLLAKKLPHFYNFNHQYYIISTHWGRTPQQH